MMAEVPAGLIGEATSNNPSETMLVVSFCIPFTRLLHISSRSINLYSKIVDALIVLSKPSDGVNQVDSSSKSDKAFTGGSRINYIAGPSILKLSATVQTEIVRA